MSVAMTENDLFGQHVHAKERRRTPANKRPPGQFGRPRRMTRADHIMAEGWTPKRLAAQTRRSLNSARAKLERLAVPWAEIDNSVQYNLDTLLAAFDEFERSLEDSVEWLLEEAPYD